MVNSVAAIVFIALCALYWSLAVGNALRADTREQRLERLGLGVSGCGFLCYALLCLFKPGLIGCALLLLLGLLIQLAGRTVYELYVFRGQLSSAARTRRFWPRSTNRRP